jgi:hypothetical protein
MENPPRFKVVEFLGHGADNPIMNRLTLQFFEIIDSGFLGLEEVQQNALTELLLELAKELLYVYDALGQYIQVEDRHEAGVRAGTGLTVQARAISFTDPTEQLRKIFEDGVVHLAIAHRKLARVAGILLDREIKGGKQLRSAVLDQLPAEDPNREWVDNDDEWLTEFYELRGLIEHEELKIARFDVDLDGAENLLVRRAALYGRTIELRAYLAQALDSMFGHAEDTIALLMDLRIRKPFGIVKNAIELYQERGFRYELGFLGQLPGDEGDGANATEMPTDS